MLKTFDEIAKFLSLGSEAFFRIVMLSICFIPIRRIRLTLVALWVLMGIVIGVWFFVFYVWYIIRFGLPEEEEENNSRDWDITYRVVEHQQNRWFSTLVQRHKGPLEKVNWKIEGF